MERFLEQRLTDRKHRLALLCGRLHGLSPLETLSRGFGYVTADTGKAVTSVKQVKSGWHLQVRLADGEMKTQVLEILSYEEEEGEHGRIVD